MNTRNRNALAVVIFWALCLVLLTLAGCSLIGLGIGAAVDSGKPSRKEIPSWEVHSIKPGTKLTIFLNSGELLTGKYIGMLPLPEEEYRRLYSEAKAGDCAILPDLGEEISVEQSQGQELRGELLGFEYQTLLLGMLPKSDEPSRIPQNTIVSITDSSGRLILPEPLQELSRAGKIPVRSKISLVSENRTVDNKLRPDTALVDFYEISQVQIHLKKSGKMTGLLVGAIIDFAVIIVVIASADDEPPPPPPDTGIGPCTCPYVYSFDGERYVVEGEAFSGSIFKSAKRTDWLKLGRLKVSDSCLVKISDELRETDFVDEAKLLVVAHPKETQVIPSFTGELHTVSDPLLPSEAVDFRGANMLRLLEAKDKNFWLSNPFGRRAEDLEDLRDGLVVEFLKPEESRSVKLLFNVQNSWWGAFLQAHFVGLQGGQVEKWYEELNSSPPARLQLFESMVREGMLLISVWDGNQWQDAGFVWEVGANAFRDQVVQLDISKIPGQILRVKLESTPGLWMVNSVQADYSVDQEVEVTELSPSRSIDRQGKDVSTLLEETDDRYYTMITGDWAELVFSCPPRNPDLQYSYIFKSTGYYLSNVPPGTQRQSQLAARLISEPGYFSQYSLRLLNQYALALVDTSQSVINKQPKQ